MFSRGVRWCVIAGLLVAPGARAATPEIVRLTAEDGVMIRGDLYLAEGRDKSTPVILLFHQAGSNRGEYVEIAQRLNGLGFHALAIDQRSGGKRWGHDNETVAEIGESTNYMTALADLEAALKWSAESDYQGKTVVWGSSYSAALVFLLAAEHPSIDAVVSFSPGEYLGNREDEVRKAASGVDQPVLVLTPAEERDRAALVFDVLPGENNKLVIPKRAVHGSSMLVNGRNEGAEEIWPEVVAFLERYGR